MKDPYPQTRELRNAILRHRTNSHGWGCNTEASQAADRRVAEKKTTRSETMMQVQTFRFKLAGMRNPDSFVVYPYEGDGGIIVQGRRTIALVNLATGRGLINWRGANPKYLQHLSPVMGAEATTFPPEFIHLAREFCPSRGDLVGASPETGLVYIG